MTPPTRRPDLAARGSVDVRRMKSRDLDGVLAIENVVYPRPWSKDLFRGELASRDRSYLVATTDQGGLRRREVVVGYAGLQMIAGEAHVVTVAAHPAWRRLGIGARLVLELLGAAAGRGAVGVTLEVRESNHPARSMYAALGFVDEGARPGYYADNREDARILWLRDLGEPEVRRRLVEAARQRGLPVPSALTAR